MRFPWMTSAAFCAALFAAVPAKAAMAQDADPDEAATEESFESAQAVLDSLKELADDYRASPSPEKLDNYFATAWERTAVYLKAKPKATDLEVLYEFGARRLKYGKNHEGFILLADRYLEEKKDAADVDEWRKYALAAKLGHEDYRKKAEKEVVSIEKEGKKDAAKALLAGEIRLIDAGNRGDAEGAKKVAEALLANKTLKDSKDVWVYRDLMRMVLGNTSAAIVEGEAFPDWAEAMEVRDLDGEAISVADFEGKVLLIDFWATWCGPCMKEMPNVIKLYNEEHENGFEVVGVTLDNRNAEERLRDTIAGKGKVEAMPWRQIYDGGGWGSGLAQRYGVNSIPKTVLIGPDGKVEAVNLRGEALDKKVRELLAASKESK